MWKKVRLVGGSDHAKLCRCITASYVGVVALGRDINEMGWSEGNGNRSKKEGRRNKRRAGLDKPGGQEGLIKDPTEIQAEPEACRGSGSSLKSIPCCATRTWDAGSGVWEGPLTE